MNNWKGSEETSIVHAPQVVSMVGSYCSFIDVSSFKLWICWQCQN